MILKKNDYIYSVFHERQKYDITYDYYDLDILKYQYCNVDIKYFYNEEIKQKIYKFYENDFIFFNENGINYKI